MDTPMNSTTRKDATIIISSNASSIMRTTATTSTDIPFLDTCTSSDTVTTTEQRIPKMCLTSSSSSSSSTSSCSSRSGSSSNDDKDDNNLIHVREDKEEEEIVKIKETAKNILYNSATSKSSFPVMNTNDDDENKAEQRKEEEEVNSDIPNPIITSLPNMSGNGFNEIYELAGVLGIGAFSTVREGYHRGSDNKNMNDIPTTHTSCCCRNPSCSCIYLPTNTRPSYAIKCIDRKKLTDDDLASVLDEVAILEEIKQQRNHTINKDSNMENNNKEHCNSNYIVQLLDFFTEVDFYYIVMERIYGGELTDKIISNNRQRQKQQEQQHHASHNEMEANYCMKQILKAIQYCHIHKIAHRDIKPQNLLLSTAEVATTNSTPSSHNTHPETNYTIKITDFGFARKVYKPKSLTTICGSTGYVAPEIVHLMKKEDEEEKSKNGKGKEEEKDEGLTMDCYDNHHGYDEHVDIWSVGVILYILLSGNLPQTEDSEQKLADQLMKGDYPDVRTTTTTNVDNNNQKTNDNDDDSNNNKVTQDEDSRGAQTNDKSITTTTTISPLAKDFLIGLLNVNPDFRLSASEALEHSWITTNLCDTHGNIINKYTIDNDDDIDSTRCNIDDGDDNNKQTPFTSPPIILTSSLLERRQEKLRQQQLQQESQETFGSRIRKRLFGRFIKN